MRATRRPRRAASRATPAPVMPPPRTSRSKGPSVSPSSIRFMAIRARRESTSQAQLFRGLDVDDLLEGGLKVVQIGPINLLQECRRHGLEALRELVAEDCTVSHEAAPLLEHQGQFLLAVQLNLLGPLAGLLLKPVV